MRSADENLVGFERCLLSDDLFGLLDDPARHTQTVDDANRDEVRSRVIRISRADGVFNDQTSREQGVDDPFTFAGNDTSADPNRHRCRVNVFGVGTGFESRRLLVL